MARKMEADDLRWLAGMAGVVDSTEMTGVEGEADDGTAGVAMEEGIVPVGDESLTVAESGMVVLESVAGKIVVKAVPALVGRIGMGVVFDVEVGPAEMGVV